MSSKRRRACMDKLPLDLVENILLRLPVKHVLHFKLLSKTYHALIKSPAFVNKHILSHQSSATHNGGNYIIFAQKENKENPKILGIVSLLPSPSQGYVPPPLKVDTASHSQQPSFDIVAGSSNGLLCLVRKRMDKNTYVIWNPTTQEHRELPNPVLGHCSALGFGYNPASDDYKLVKLWSDGSSGTVEFWSMKRNSWREVEIGSEPPYIGEPRFGRSNYVGGSYPYIETGVMASRKLYWLTAENRFLMSFDMVNDSFCSKITVPGAITGQRFGHRTKIFEFRGSVGLFAYHFSREPRGNISEFDIWVMDNDQDENLWTKQFSIKTSEAGGMPTRVSFNGKLLLSAWNCEHNNTKFVLYDPERKQRKEVEAKLSTQDFCFLPPWNFIESLVSPNRTCTDQ